MHALNRTTDPGPGSISTGSDGFDSDFNIWTLSELTCMKSCTVFTKVTGMSSKTNTSLQVTSEINVMGLNS